MRKNILIVFLFIVSYVFCQTPAIAWQKRFGGSGEDIPSAIIQTNDGGLLVGGRSHSNASFEKTENSRGGSDYWIIKTDNLGNIGWDKTIGGDNQYEPSLIYRFDILRKVVQSPDGGYLLAGDSNSPISGEKSQSCRGDYDYWIVKIDASGNILWQKAIGGSLVDNLNTCIATIDGGYLLCGNSSSNTSGEKSQDAMGINDIWLVKISSIGAIEWQQTIGGDGRDGANDVIQNSDGTYIVLGNSDSSVSGNKTEPSKGQSDIWMLKLDGLGNILSQKTIGGSGQDGYSGGIIQTTDNNYVVSVGSISPVSGDKADSCRGFADIWVLKLNQQFNITWQKTYGGDKNEGTRKCLQTADGGFLVNSNSESSVSGDKDSILSGFTDAWILKLDANGTLQWQKAIGGTAPGTFNGTDGIINAFQLADGSFLMGGGTDSNISGDIVDFPRGDNDYWLVKLNAENLSSVNFETNNEIKIFPNPAYDFFEIKNIFAEYQLIDTVGRIVKVGLTNEKINVSNLQSGTYIIKVIGNDGISYSEKLIKN